MVQVLSDVSLCSAGQLKCREPELRFRVQLPRARASWLVGIFRCVVSCLAASLRERVARSLHGFPDFID